MCVSCPVAVSLSHGNDIVDAPDPAFGGAATELNANRADLDFHAIVFQHDAVTVARRGVDHFAQEQVHAPMIPRIGAGQNRLELEIDQFGNLNVCTYITLLMALAPVTDFVVACPRRFSLHECHAPNSTH